MHSFLFFVYQHWSDCFGAYYWVVQLFIVVLVCSLSMMYLYFIERIKKNYYVRYAVGKAQFFISSFLLDDLCDNLIKNGRSEQCCVCW
jgi:hypothetical protein